MTAGRLDHAMATALRMALAMSEEREHQLLLTDLDDEQTLAVAVAAVVVLVGTLRDVVGEAEAGGYLRRLLLETTWGAS